MVKLSKLLLRKSNLSQKNAQTQLFALAHSHLSQNVFIQKIHLRSHWKALSKGLATGLSKLLMFESIGLYTGFSVALFCSQNVTILGLKMKMSIFAQKTRSNVKNNTRNVFLAQNRTYWLFLLYNFIINMSNPQ